MAYIYGIEACKLHIDRIVFKLDLSHLHPENSDDEVGAFSLKKDEPTMAKGLVLALLLRMPQRPLLRRPPTTLWSPCPRTSSMHICIFCFFLPFFVMNFF